MTTRHSPAATWPALLLCFLLLGIVHRTFADPAPAEPPPAAPEAPEVPANEAEAKGEKASVDFRELVVASGFIGLVILALSVAMVALLVEHAISIRLTALLPPGLVEEVHGHLVAGRTNEARQAARESQSFLGRVLDAGLADADLGYEAVVKSVEDTAVGQTSRLYRKIEWLSIIGTIAPMLGLLGTVWGMIGAFAAFEANPNPQVAELAPGITRALVTTLLGLGVAVPALAGYGFFRNRIEGMTDEGTQLAEHVFGDLKRAESKRRPTKRTAREPRRPAPETEPRA